MRRSKRGRGGARGGTRGGVATKSQAPALDEQPSTSATEPVSTPPNDSMSANAIPLEQQTPFQASPNMSPASVPTETPASTPARPPIQRLESITSGPSTRGGSTTRGRFKPRPIRRDKDERERLEREEQARLSTRNARLVTRGAPTGGGRVGLSRGGMNNVSFRRRGRGDAMGRGRLMASGPFGVAPASSDKRPTPGVASRRVGDESENTVPKTSGRKTRASTVATSLNTIVKQEPSPLPVFSNDGLPSVMDLDNEREIKNGIPEPIYPWDQGGGRPAPRVDIESINISDDSDEEPLYSGFRAKGTMSSNRGGLKPVRLHRQEHKERVTMVNTEPIEIMNSAVEQDEDVAIVSREVSLSYRRQSKDLDHVQIKYDPAPIVDAMDVDAVAGVSGETSKVRSATARSKSVYKLASKDRTPVMQTEEEKAEFRRHEIDIKILAQELHDLHSGPIAVDEEDDKAPQRDLSGQGRLYLFQFPPILPPLLNAAKVNEEKDELEMTATRPIPQAATTSRAPVSTPDEAVVIKLDPDTQGVQGPPELLKEEGFIGKLVVRESGKVELDWGGTSLQLGRGAEFDFLTTTMVINEESSASMGSVMGKFVATPDWSKMFDME